MRGWTRKTARRPALLSFSIRKIKLLFRLGEKAFEAYNRCDCSIDKYHVLRARNVKERPVACWDGWVILFWGSFYFVTPAPVSHFFFCLPVFRELSIVTLCDLPYLYAWLFNETVFSITRYVLVLCHIFFLICSDPRYD